MSQPNPEKRISLERLVEHEWVTEDEGQPKFTGRVFDVSAASHA